MREFDFNAQLSRMSADHVLANCWESRPMLLKRADHTYYESIMTATDLERRVSRGAVDIGRARAPEAVDRQRRSMAACRQQVREAP